MATFKIEKKNGSWGLKRYFIIDKDKNLVLSGKERFSGNKEVALSNEYEEEVMIIKSKSIWSKKDFLIYDKNQNPIYNIFSANQLFDSDFFVESLEGNDAYYVDALKKKNMLY